MNFHVISIFPDFVRAVFEHGVLRRAVDAGLIGFSLTDPRDFTGDKHRTTDDTPYGGGPGMVMLAEPLFRAIASLRELYGADTPVIYLSPSGELLTQALAEELAEQATRVKGQGAREDGTRDQGLGTREEGQGPRAMSQKQEAERLKSLEDKETDTDDEYPGTGENWATNTENLEPGRSARDSCPSALVPCASLILLCGRYEGIDQRLLEEVGAREVSIGDYVISGGELAAMVFIDAVTRLIPGVLGNDDSAGSESFTSRPDGACLLDWPHFTRPEIWHGRRVPEVLLSGNHAKILGFREDAALLLTYQRRPDLLTPELRQRAERLLEAQTGQPGQA